MARCDRCTHNASVPVSPKVKEEALQEAEELPVSTGTSAALLSSHSGPSKDVDVAKTYFVRSEFEFPGDLASVTESREQVMQFVCQHCPDEAERIDILVALQEALANAAVHGCGNDPAKRIQCSVAADASEVTITVRDPGPGFDLALADPENFAASTLSHGRGICLIRSMMTEISFVRGGSEVRMRKLISHFSP